MVFVLKIVVPQDTLLDPVSIAIKQLFIYFKLEIL